jgi:hypothetical protein
MFLNYIHSSNGTDTSKGSDMTPQLRVALGR